MRSSAAARGIWIIRSCRGAVRGVYALVQFLGLLVGRFIGIVIGMESAFKTETEAGVALVFAGHTFPGYSAFYTLVLKLVSAAVLTPSVSTP